MRHERKREEGWEGEKGNEKEEGGNQAGERDGEMGRGGGQGKRKEGTEIDSQTYKEAEADKYRLWETDQQPPKQKTEEKAAMRQSNWDRKTRLQNSVNYGLVRSNSSTR